MENTGHVLSYIPLQVVLFPLVGFFWILLSDTKIKKHRPYQIAVLGNVGALILLLTLIPVVARGEKVGVKIEWLFEPFGLHFVVTRIGLMMAILSGLLWLLATLYSNAYLSNKVKQKRYYAFLELTLVGCLGVYLTGNLFSLFIFFEILSLAPFVLIMFNETEESLRAGYLYLTLSVFGGISLLLGLIMLYSQTGTLEISQVAEHLSHSFRENWWIAILMIMGFGVKAGIVPLHIWLPEAHPVAPTPTSALLSGVMIKAGAYGIFLTLGQVFFHEEMLLEELGYLLIWIGTVTMLVGAFSALRQNDAKRLLAYSSVSQMGYIILAFGLAAYLGHHGTIGFLGAFFHIFNHAIFKVGFFLTIGIIYKATHEKRLDRLGGLLRAMPITAGVYLLFAGGIVGVPGFNAYGSKTLIHHTITEAIHLKHGAGLQLVEYLFILTGAVTFAYMTKMYICIFHGRQHPELKIHKFNYRIMRGVTVPLGVLVILTGVMPGVLMRHLFRPLISETGFDLYVAEDFFHNFSFWNSSDILGVLQYVLLGSILFWLEIKYKLFTRLLPGWLGIRQTTHGLARFIGSTFQLAYRETVRWIHWASENIQKVYHSGAERLVAFDRDPKTSKVGPISIVSLDFSKLLLALVIVVFLLLSLLRVIDLS